ncbi:hypothetical protein SAMN05216357_110100 [Porphyromonadaceae bacterium KH3CP3RA]|nr:hypothetical protein SAMN05216357_110100 [Porphyromonadaceae bacterium KH3CP3RA]
MGVNNNAKIIAAIRKNLLNKKWNCIVDDCNHEAINSHLIQRNGILKNLAEDGHVYEVGRKDIFKLDRVKTPFEFKCIGISKSISHPVFCSNHDNNLFHDIDQSNIDISNNKTWLLFSYRAICAELRKKEIEKEFMYRIMNSRTLPLFATEKAKWMHEGFSMGCDDLKKYMKFTENELQNTTDDFTFHHFKFPLLEICASSLFSFQETTHNIDEIRQIEIMHGGVVHILPLNGYTHIIFGYNKNNSNINLINYIESWNNINNVEFGRKLTELLSSRIEGWCLSPQLYNQIPDDLRSSFIKILTENISTDDINMYVDFNLFENII